MGIACLLNSVSQVRHLTQDRLNFRVTGNHPTQTPKRHVSDVISEDDVTEQAAHTHIHVDFVEGLTRRRPAPQLQNVQSSGVLHEQ